jgi:DNA repair protein RadA/Sms
MKKPRSKYVCQQCGGEYANWFGKCPSCSSWNSIVEEIEKPDAGIGASKSIRASRPGAEPIRLSEIPASGALRRSTGIEELDRVLGGGIVPGSVVLVSGEPGIGKSTLLLQMAARLAEDASVLYVSGEESVHQVGMRARRIKADSDRILVMPETDAANVLEAAARMNPAVLVVDSIQTMQDSSLSSAAGSVGQVRQCASLLIEASKTTGMAVFMVGHVTKTGAVAGPKVLEHMVDTVLQFEGGGFAGSQEPFRSFPQGEGGRHGRFGGCAVHGGYQAISGGASSAGWHTGRKLPAKDGFWRGSKQGSNHAGRFGQAGRPCGRIQ